MPGPAVPLLERFSAIEDDQRYTRLVELFTDDAVYYDPFFGPQRGKDAIRTFMEHMETVVPGSGARFEDWRVEGDTTCGWATWVMVARGVDGDDVPVPGQSLYRLRDGKVSFVADHVGCSAYRRLRGPDAKTPDHAAALGLAQTVELDAAATASASHALLDRFWATQDERRYADLADLFAPDARFTDLVYGEFAGRDAIAAYLRRMETEMPALNATFVRVDQAADDTVGWTQWWCRFPGGDVPGWTLHKFADGLITLDADYFDTNAARAARP
jgi:ketosteroid isomerase-like protein